MLKNSLLVIFLIMFIINFNQACNCQTHKEELDDIPRKSSLLISDDTLIISEKNPAIAFGCSLIIPGLGQMYNEDVGKGFIYFSGSVAGLYWLLPPTRMKIPLKLLALVFIVYLI
jgi:hypothetical protein